MSLSETANADSVKTDMLAAKVGSLTPMVDNMSTDVGNNTTGIKTTTDTITTVLKQKVNDVNKKVGKDITDKSNAPAPITGTSQLTSTYKISRRTTRGELNRDLFFNLFS